MNLTTKPLLWMILLLGGAFTAKAAGPAEHETAVVAEDFYRVLESRLEDALKGEDYGKPAEVMLQLAGTRSARAVVKLGSLLADTEENNRPRVLGGPGSDCHVIFDPLSASAARALAEMDVADFQHVDYSGRLVGEELGRWRNWWAANQGGFISRARVEIPMADPFKKPFKASSVWNKPIPAGAIYEAVAGLEKIHGGINWNERWTTFVYKTDVQSNRRKLFIHPSSLWSLRQSGAVAATGNSDEIEHALRAASAAMNAFPANYYSTTVKSPPGVRTFPADITKIEAHWRDFIYVPASEFSPSPDTDGHLAIWQPGGLVLEVYGAVVCKNGDVIGSMASFSDPTGDGSGLANGRCASLIPNYAGLIREGEVASGLIDHALACTFPAALLAPRAVFPAMAFDMNDGYKGTVPMGALLALPTSLNLDSLKLSPGGLVIARAAQRYGIYVVDRGGEGLTLKADQNATDAVTTAIRNDLTNIVRALKIVLVDIVPDATPMR